MRKGIMLIAVILFVAAICAVCNAETMVRHDVAGYGISVEIPQDWYYTDRAIQEGDPAAGKTGMTPEQIRENLDSNNFAFMAESLPLGENDSSALSVNLSVWNQDADNYIDYSDAELQELSNQYAEYLATDGYAVVKAECVGNRLKFLKAVLKDNQYHALEIRYLTAHNGVAYGFSCYEYESDLLDKVEPLCDAIVCSLEAEEPDVAGKKDAGQETDGNGAMNRYTVAGLDCSISFPADWLYGDVNVQDDSPVLVPFGITAQEFRNKLNNSGTSFVAATQDLTQMLMMQETETGYPDFDDVPESDLMNVGEGYANASSEQYNIDKVVLYSSGNRFIKVVMTSKQNDMQSLHYLTVKDGKLYTFIMDSDIVDTALNEKTIESVLDTFTAGKTGA